MIRRIAIACLAAMLVVIPPAAAMEGTPCPDMGNRFPAPANEIEQVIADWLGGQGFMVRQASVGSGEFHLSARTSREGWDIRVRPQSALAASVAAIYHGPRPAADACRQLRESIDGYLLDAAPAPSQQVQQPCIPKVVREKTETVVCILANTKTHEIQFSGFVIDPDGLVLCTAHNLTDHQAVSVIFSDGTRMPGTIAGLDLGRDLALIACKASDLPFVSLADSRNLLDRGEPIFSIGCPNNLGITLAPGTINGPPRRMGPHPLWQVDMQIYPGSSGSPVFDGQGRLVAMVKGRYRGTTSVGFLTPVETMFAFLLKEIGSETEASRSTATGGKQVTAH
ncbi:S1C family serine protease [Desulfosarcina ovata]|uniref:Serine protease n=1 Tax=Desulfosarcina ovata subsp. ovata TaxID=2752305 RepID=A0A5K8AET6_9BACT|nr:serine protease [Desulfosarcina ovata]BBO91081.1 hypothetical protein DSCOOX_42610 [Desulfosarcina ovata subsp. ovata]